ncbi:MAG TPA: class II aldolase/adducin family protein [Acidimicrobiia bacterium]|nr:class II aldolase/adducin family protein [Acidimicrobiia bacterium]
MTWPSAVPGLGRGLTLRQSLACALRVLAHEGWQENLSGHITWADDDGETIWANPWGMWWSEVRAADIVRVGLDGRVVEGQWDVTPAVFLHTELHRARPDARVVVHNHPYAATVLACLGVEPVIAHQNAGIFDGELACVDEYDGTVESEAAGRWLAERVGNASGVLLANHGAIVTGESVGAACYRAVTFERMCRFTLDALQARRELRPLPVGSRPALKGELIRNTPDAYWHGAVRQLLAREPEVLEE